MWNENAPPGGDAHEYDDGGGPKSKQPCCQRCGSRDVGWVHTGVRWRLYDQDVIRLHVCGTQGKASDFEGL